MRNLACALLFTMSAVTFAALNDVDKAMIWPKNILKNGGFENGKSNWSVGSGSITLVSSGSNLLTGKNSLTWDASAASVTLAHTAVTVPNGLLSKNGVAACKILTASGTATHRLEAYDGTNVLGSVTITSSTIPAYSYVNFIYPSSGTVKLQLVSNADEPQIAIDDCFLGDASEINLTNITQPQFIGAAYYATTTNCLWSVASTTYADFSADTDCPAPTVVINPGPGTIDTTDNNLPQITVNNLPPGSYKVVAFGQSGPNGNVANSLALSDGSVTIGGPSGASSTNNYGGFSIEGWFTYTTSGDRTFKMQGAAASGSQQILNRTTGARLNFTITRYPLSSEQALKPDLVSFAWTGHHDYTCAWTNTINTFTIPAGDASCAFNETYNGNFGNVTSTADGTGNTPGVSFVPKRAGAYRVCANVVAYNNGTLANDYLRLVDIAPGGAVTTQIARGMQRVSGSANDMTIPLCGAFTAASANSQKNLYVQTATGSGTITAGMSAAGANGVAINWDIFPLAQNIPAPLLVNSVVSPSSGVTNICSGYITVSGSTPSVSRSDGNCAASVADGGTGDTTVTFATGTFSSAPNCTVTVQSTSDFGWRIEAATTSTTLRVTTRTTSTGGAADNINWYFICVGAK